MNAYGSLSSKFYEADKPEAPEASLNFYRDILDRHREQRPPEEVKVYEPMCGTGRYLIPLATNGYKITGSDGSESMLEICRKKLAAQDLRVPLFHHLLQEKSYPQAFDAIIIPEGSFCLLTDMETVKQTLRVLRESLKPGGLLAMEVELHRSRPSWDSPWGGRWSDLPEGSRIIISWLSRYDARTNLMTSVNRYELVEGQTLVRTEYEEFSLRLYDPVEIRSTVEMEGFSGVELLEAHSFRPVPAEADTLVVLGRKAQG